MKGTTPELLAHCGEMGDDWIYFEISECADGFSCTPQTVLSGSKTTPEDSCFYDIREDPKAKIGKGTPIETAGVYGVFCPAMSLYLKPTKGTAKVHWQVPR